MLVVSEKPGFCICIIITKSYARTGIKFAFLFQLVFGSVSLFANENEQMLKPHLHTIVTKSMSLANTAQDPYNYFLLLRALFRSIGGGSHDSLYQEFLPLLPNLLQGEMFDAIVYRCDVIHLIEYYSFCLLS